MDDKEIEKYFNECIKYSDKIKNPILEEVSKRIFNDYKRELINKPATSSGRHHYFKGGLLFHSYCVTRNAYNIVKMYPNLNVDLDLVIFGALLHDIGKINEFNDFEENDNYNALNGNSSDLLGHSYEGTHIVDKYLSEYCPENDLKSQALHMIGSHMKDFREEGVFVKPKMLEVIIISLADNIDTYLEPASKALKNVEKGERYEFSKAEIPYYKSLNPYYNDGNI